MEKPKLRYNENLLKHCSKVKPNDKNYMWINLEKIGSGVTGTTYTAYSTTKEYNDPVILKELERNSYCINEIEALKFLREQMIEGTIPAYFIFMYDYFNSGKYKYIILEKADYNLEEYLVENDFDTKKYLEIFWQIADAVSYLEALNFNHGDLWDENVMISWLPNQDHIPLEKRKFTIKIIDYDSAFKTKSKINHPSYGGASSFRKDFILGYDLNRFFDSLLYLQLALMITVF